MTVETVLMKRSELKCVPVANKNPALGPKSSGGSASTLELCCA